MCVCVQCYFKAVNRCEGECEAREREREKINEEEEQKNITQCIGNEHFSSEKQ